MNKKTLTIISFVFAAFAAGIILFKNRFAIIERFSFESVEVAVNAPNGKPPQKITVEEQPTQKHMRLVEPVLGFSKRVSKKPFGLHVAPGNSPITPERFQGYHTGADAEIFSGEENKNIFIQAVADGTVVLTRQVAGYGGLVIIRHRIAQKTVFGIYGHIRLSSVILKTNDSVAAGNIIGVLGTANSADTGGERKHLHFGLYAGESPDIRGYVQKQEELSNWLNPLQFF